MSRCTSGLCLSAISHLQSLTPFISLQVLVAMLPGKVPIDVAVKEGSTRYKGESEGFSVPVLDPV